MEDLPKLNKLKPDRFDEFTKDQEERFMYYVSVAEELMPALKSSEEELKSLIDDLKNEVDSIRSFRNEHSTECQKHLMEEEKMAEAFKLYLEWEKERLTKEEQCTKFTRSPSPMSDADFEKHIELLVEEKLAQFRANELATLSSSPDEECTHCTEYQKLLMDEELKVEKLQLLLAIEKEITQANELASIRSTFDEYQKLTMDNKHKAEELMMKIQKERTQSQDDELDFLRSPQNDELKMCWRKQIQELVELDQLYTSRMKDAESRKLCTLDGGQTSGATNKREREEDEK